MTNLGHGMMRQKLFKGSINNELTYLITIIVVIKPVLAMRKLRMRRGRGLRVLLRFYWSFLCLFFFEVLVAPPRIIHHETYNVFFGIKRKSILIHNNRIDGLIRLQSLVID